MIGELVKIYHIKTQEEFDYLLVELEKEGYVWDYDADKLTLFNTEEYWDFFGQNTCVFVYDNSMIAWGRLPDTDEVKVPILPVTLPTTDNVEKPRHYQGIHGLEVKEVERNFIPRYKNSYIAHLVANAIEYLLRAPLKNGVEDIKKAYHCIGLALEELGEDETI